MKFSTVLFISFLAFTLFALLTTRLPAEVRIKDEGGSFVLLADGKSFDIRGVGGTGSLALLKSAGGNAIRTWTINENTPALLDEAHRLGIKVALGYWLGHERHGFDYTHWDSVVGQAEELFAAVKKYKDHPALLLWGIGNEMEGFNQDCNPAIYLTIEYLARRVKEIDSHHPVMTVTAEIRSRQVEGVNRFCPSIDIHGINSYGGVVSLPERYRKAGGIKPYIVTEYGPPGNWETKLNQWGRPDEPTSTAKANFYRQGFQAVQADPLCLGSFAFVWGSKQEGTATWFGMLLPGGDKLACVDALTELWTTQPPVNRCPEIESISRRGPNLLLDPGTIIEVDLKATDPENDSLSYRWVLAEDWQETAQGGDHRPDPPIYPGAILNQGEASPVKIKMPERGGNYRIYAYVHDGRGGAATANLSIMVRGTSFNPVAVEKLPQPVSAANTEKPGP